MPRQAKSSSKNMNTRAAAADANEDFEGDEAPGPACHLCRKKKAKCSRTQPCTHCARYKLDCVYEEKARPGFKTGAIEHLNRRLDALENMFLGQGVLWQQVLTRLDGLKGPLLDSDDTGLRPDFPTPDTGTLQQYTNHLQKHLLNVSQTHQDREESAAQAPANKKRRLNDGAPADLSRAGFASAFEHGLPELPPDDLMSSLVDIYFTNFHPWIPILHAQQFRERLAKPSQRNRISTILHAITSLCVRFSDDPQLHNPEVRATYVRRCRDTVILRSMESFSIENLQAMIICALDTLGSGRGPSAWSIIGSMTRTVEQLQLSVEEDEQSQSARLIHRLAFLPPSDSWIEVETRRRVFWNVFLMDRFCSITTGWNLSLTSADVHRRLPCEGALWEAGEGLQSPTPYFGVANPSHTASTALPLARQEQEDQQSLGGFAYCIEATESLGLVTTFFLQQAVDVHKVSSVQIWLMRFKELDLRLIRWKLFLPERWQEACVLNDDGIMDPNLTLAHITHNTAVVLLHQGIAYPTPEWLSIGSRLPSASSAETCLAATTEVSIIAQKFLQCSRIPTNPQFAFCLFVCGRLSLVHSSYYAADVSEVYESILESLWEVSRRWSGLQPSNNVMPGDNLASKFARRLLQAQQQGLTSMDIRQEAYAQDAYTEMNASESRLQSMASSQIAPKGMIINEHVPSPPSSMNVAPVPCEVGFDPARAAQAYAQDSPDSISMAFPPLPPAFQGYMVNRPLITPQHGQGPEVPSAPARACTVPSNPNSMPLESSPVVDMDDINSFLNYNYMLSQRVSMFSHDSEKYQDGRQLI